ncbi:hypothetical protein SteCoe_20457 [Stentor coeruleus]|uniref:Uncharacterized protein n=1 Tax=Stentor coeruleus TaxID=5963 RepID=A0A1R2BRU4_9CILI|nr:hypothetical protein SteCoe_20457 [Stentor coeruleus]
MFTPRPQNKSNPSFNIESTKEPTDNLERPPSSKTSSNKNLSQEIKDKESLLAGLNNEIRNRQKVVSQMMDKNSDTALQEKLKTLEEEVLLRDRQMTVLNDRLIVLDAQLKENHPDSHGKQKDEYILKLQEDIIRLGKDKEIMDEKARNNETSWRNEKKKWENERDKLIKDRENVVKNEEKTKMELEKTQNALVDGQNDIKKLKEINENANTSIANLNKKTLELSQELEKSSETIYQCNLKIKAGEELQKSLQELKENLNKSENEIKTKNYENEELKAQKSKLETVCYEQSLKVQDVQILLREEARKTKELETQLNIKESSYKGELDSVTKQLNQAISQLQVVKNELEDKKTLEAEVKMRLDQNFTYQNRIKSMESTLKEKDRQISLIQSQESTMKDRIKELEIANNTIKTEKNLQEKSSNDKIKLLESEIDDLKKKAKNTGETLAEKNSDLQKLQNSNIDLLHKMEETKKYYETLGLKYTNFDQQLKDTKYRSGMFENKCQELEKDNNIKEAQIKEAISKLKCLENDIMAKESLLIQKDSIISKLSKDVDDMKKTLQQAHAKFRITLAEEMKNFEAKLEDKEREIKILKDMIRSGQTQLKQREGELSRFKGGGQLNSVSARSPMSSKKDLKTEAFHLAENFSKSTL